MSTKYQDYRLLQVNIEGGKYYPALASQLKQGYDFITMQEVGNARGQVPGKQLFEKILADNPDYAGHLQPMFQISEAEGHFVANAILWRKNYKLLSTAVIQMQDGHYDKDNIDPLKFPLSATVAVFEVEGKKLMVISGHFLWGKRPYDTDYTIINARKVADYIEKSEVKDFILCGDFNVDSRSVTVQQFEHLGRNLGLGLGVKNTLNPANHRAQQLFPEGIACDQVIVSRELRVNGFRVITDNDMSDHYGLELWFNLPQAGKPLGGLEG
jgi:endonuclease/exonuclease/phosphatase family metal-dependent hydrolase